MSLKLISPGRLLLAAVFALASFGASAQIEAMFPDTIDNSFNYLLGGYGGYEANSSALDRDFMSTLYKGGFIDNEMKDRVSKRLMNNNRLGIDLNYALYYAWKPDTFFHNKSDVSLFVQLKNNEHFDTQFTKDLFLLGFYGNRQFAGDTAFLNNTSARLLRFQELQFGVLWSGLDSTARLGIGVSLINAEQYFSVSAKRAELYTSADGGYIDFGATMDVYTSDTSNTGYGAFNGFGVAADFFFEAPYKGKRKGMISISASDVGLLFWNKSSQRYSTDSTYHYEGVEVESILEADNSTSQLSPDSLLSSIASSKQSFAVSVPATLHIRQASYFGRFELVKGFRYVFNTSYKGFFYLEGNYSFGNRLRAGITTGFGGYGRFSFGANVSKVFNNRTYMSIGSSHLEGFVAPKRFAGQAVYVSLRQKF
jgi:hypothetical protein